MASLRALYRWLVRRLPPRAAWALWRAVLLAASVRRRRVPGPHVALAQLAWGASEKELEALIDRLLGAGASPTAVLVVSDCDAVHLAAARGCRLEYVPKSDDWLRAFPAGSYETFLFARGRAIGEAYRIERLEAPRHAPEALLKGLREASAAALSGG